MAKRDIDQAAGAKSPGEEPEQSSGRPWSMAAAMEPLPPLAPPVEDPLPSDARISIAVRRSGKTGNRLWMVLFILVLIAVCVLLLLHYR